MASEDVGNERPQRAGQKWTVEENERLMQRAKKGRSIEEIAKKHQRTILAVKLRIYDNAKEMVDAGANSTEEVCDMFNISQQELEDHIKKRTNKELRKEEIKPSKQNKEFTKSTLCCPNEVLLEIRDLLKLLVEKEPSYNLQPIHRNIE